MDGLPATQLCYKSDKGWSILQGPPSESAVLYSSENEVRLFKYSPDGALLACLMGDHVLILSTEGSSSPNELTRLPGSFLDIEFSPKGHYFSTFGRYVKGTEEEPHENVTMWAVATGAKVFSYTQKTQTKNWAVQWTANEEFFGRMVSTEVQFFEVAQMGAGPKFRLKLEAMHSFSISPGFKPIIAVFIPEKKGAPASIRLYSLGQFDAPVAQKSFYRADNIDYLWNSTGNNILAFTHTDVDNTGQSYYGETNLYYLAANGQFDCRVDLEKEGPIHDVVWNPNGQEFAVVYGTMPSRMTLFNHRADAIYDFGEASRNTVKFSPQGRLIYIAGFGNLTGEIDIWDRKALKQIASFLASNASSCEWSPDGRHLLMATLYRRLKVDNGIKVYHYSGALVHQTDVKEMYQALWKPAKATLWPERTGSSPPPKSIATSAPPPKKAMGAYRPPGARNGSDAPVQRETLDSLTSKLKNTRVVPGAAKSIPGLNKEDRQKGKPNKAVVIVPPPAPIASVDKGPEKRIKAIQKKLKQIGDIKMKIAAGEIVELTQVQKLATEATLQQELESLTADAS